MKNEKWTMFNVNKPPKKEKKQEVIGAEEQMANTSKKEESTTEKPENKPNFTRFMVGTYTHPVTGEWMLGFVAFNPATGAVGELQSEKVAGDQEIMRERLMIKQSQLGLFDSAPITEEKKMEIY